MGKIKRVEISEAVIEFTRSQTSGMSREYALEHIEKMMAGEIDFSANKRIKRCLQCEYWFEDSRANKRKCCSSECKKRYDSANRKGKRQEVTAAKQGITVDELQAKRAKGRFEVVLIGDDAMMDYFHHGGNDGNRKKITMELDESGEGKPNVMVNYGQRKVDREPGEVQTTVMSRADIDAYFTEKYGEHRLKMERMRAKGLAKRSHFVIE